MVSQSLGQPVPTRHSRRLRERPLPTPKPPEKSELLSPVPDQVESDRVPPKQVHTPAVFSDNDDHAGYNQTSHDQPTPDRPLPPPPDPECVAWIKADPDRYHGLRNILAHYEHRWKSSSIATLKLIKNQIDEYAGGSRTKLRYLQQVWEGQVEPFLTRAQINGVAMPTPSEFKPINHGSHRRVSRDSEELKYEEQPNKDQQDPIQDFTQTLPKAPVTAPAPYTHNSDRRSQASRGAKPSAGKSDVERKVANIVARVNAAEMITRGDQFMDRPNIKDRVDDTPLNSNRLNKPSAGANPNHPIAASNPNQAEHFPSPLARTPRLLSSPNSPAPRTQKRHKRPAPPSDDHSQSALSDLEGNSLNDTPDHNKSKHHDSAVGSSRKKHRTGGQAPDGSGQDLSDMEPAKMFDLLSVYVRKRALWFYLKYRIWTDVVIDQILSEVTPEGESLEDLGIQKDSRRWDFMVSKLKSYRNDFQFQLFERAHEYADTFLISDEGVSWVKDQRKIEQASRNPDGDANTQDSRQLIDTDVLIKNHAAVSQYQDVVKRVWRYFLDEGEYEQIEATSAENCSPFVGLYYVALYLIRVEIWRRKDGFNTQKRTFSSAQRNEHVSGSFLLTSDKFTKDCHFPAPKRRKRSSRTNIGAYKQSAKEEQFFANLMAKGIRLD